MKKIISIVFICIPIFCQAQTYVQMKHDSLFVSVGSYHHPLNSLRPKWGDSSLAIFGTDNTTFVPDRKYNLFKDENGIPFSSIDSLIIWVDKYFFVKASGGSAAGGFIGGHSFMTGNGTTIVFNITTNAGFIPSYFTLTTTTPITQNQLNRTITFPDANTMRITFDNAPLTGENTDYVWIVFK